MGINYIYFTHLYIFYEYTILFFKTLNFRSNILILAYNTIFQKSEAYKHNETQINPQLVSVCSMTGS